MPIIEYNKLIRDKVPQVIEANGAKPKTRILSMKEYERVLREKLVEEAREVGGAQTEEALLKELADVAEVLATLQNVHGISDQVLMQARDDKNEKRGAFAERIFLESVEE